MSSPDYLQIAEVAVASSVGLTLLFFAIKSILNNLALLGNRNKNQNSNSYPTPSALMGTSQIANLDQRSRTLIPLSNRGMTQSKKNKRHKQ